jgi:hypothetical protein
LVDHAFGIAADVFFGGRIVDRQEYLGNAALRLSLIGCDLLKHFIDVFFRDHRFGPKLRLISLLQAMVARI